MEIIQHRTPGKWVGLNCKVTGGELNKVILTTPADKLVQERAANVKLASAAPDLLESLEELVHYFTDHTHTKPTALRPIISKAQKAIGKAKGWEPDHCEAHINKSEVMEIVNNAINNLR